MTRNELVAELARLTSAPPIRIPAFAAERKARIAELTAQLNAPEVASVVVNEDPILARWFDQQRKAENAQRRMERRGY
jgi:hypothetical protein